MPFLLRPPCERGLFLLVDVSEIRREKNLLSLPSPGG